MKHFIIIATASAIFVCCQSTATAQRGGILRGLVEEFGGQVIEQQLGRIQQRQRPQIGQPPQDGRPTVQSTGIPGESGSGSGGDRRGFNPEFGFILPGNGAQPQPGFVVQPQPLPQPQPQPRPIVQPQPSFNNPNQPFDGRTIFIEGQRQPSPQFYQQPSQPFYSQPTTGLSVQSSSDMPSAPVMTSDFVLIRCPAETVGSISYTLSSDQGNFSFTLSAGQEQRFRANGKWSISYNNGSKQLKHPLRGGMTYAMKRTSDGNWQLFSTSANGK